MGQPQALHSTALFKPVGRFRAGGCTLQAPRTPGNLHFRSLSGTDTVTSTSNSTPIGSYGVEFSTGRGLRRRAVCVVCAACPEDSQGEGGKDSKRRNGFEGLRRYSKWKWHEKRGPPCNNTRMAHVHDTAPDVYDCRGTADVSPPVHLPGKDDVDGTELGFRNRPETPEEEFRKLAAKYPMQLRSGTDMIQEAEKYCSLFAEVYVVLFGVGEAATEGIYSLRSQCRNTGLNVETIVCFECNEDAFRFASLLEATMTHGPTVHTIQPTDLVKFCEESGYQCRLEPKGSMIVPPEFNVGITDWERSLRLREGIYTVLDEEPQFETQGQSSTMGEKRAEAPELLHNSLEDKRRHVEMSQSIAMELNEVRAMLERLLPDD